MNLNQASFSTKARTWILLAGLTALFIGVGWAIGGAALWFFLIFSVLMNLAAYFWSDKFAIKAARAKEVSEAEAPELHHMIAELAALYEVPKPRVFMIPSEQPNAFATGRNPEHAAVAVTVGITQLLDRRELRAVIGHELSHVYNRDILISSVAAALAGMITMLAQLAIFLPLGGSDDDDRPNPAALLAMLILGPLAASVIQLAISRNREFQADASGAELTRDPLALASALEKIQYGAQRLPLPADGQLTSAAHLMIANPFRGGGLTALFSTHPPMEERIDRLRQQAALTAHR